MSNNIPEEIGLYNVYNANDKLVGVTDVTLPTFDPVTNTVSGAGILGEYDSTVPGYFSSAEIEIPIRILDNKAAEFLNVNGSMLYLRAAVDTVDPSTMKHSQKSVKVSIGGNPKGVTPGTVGNAKPMESTVKMEVLYFKYEYDNKTVMELDKLNMVYVINGVDQLAEIKGLI